MKILQILKFSSALLTILMIIYVPCSIAGWKIPGTGGICIGFGCDGEPIVGSEWVKKRWEDLGQTPASVTKICQHVGTSCLDSNFINIFQLLRVGQYAGMYQNVDDCAATGFSMSSGGYKAAQYIALAKGVVLPSEFMTFSQAMTDQHIIGACEVLFNSQFNQYSISYVDEGTYTTKGNENSIRDAIKKRSGQQGGGQQGGGQQGGGQQGGGQQGLPRGYGMQMCGCWGANPTSVPEPRCASGWVIPYACQGNFCAPGHPPYGFLCG